MFSYFKDFVAYLYSIYLMLFVGCIARISALKTKKYDDKGHPGRTPLAELKYSVCQQV